MEVFRGHTGGGTGAGVVHRRVAGCNTGTGCSGDVTCRTRACVCTCARLLFYISARDDGLVLRFRRRSTRHARGPRSPPVSKLKLERPHAIRASGWRRAPHAQYHASHACAGPRDRVVCGPPPSSSRSCSRPRWHCTQTAAHAPADTMHAISAVPSAGVESRQSEAGSRQSATISRFAAS